MRISTRNLLVAVGILFLHREANSQGLWDNLIVDYGENCATTGTNMGGIVPPNSTWAVNVHCKSYNKSVACISEEGEPYGTCQCNLGDSAYFDENQKRCLGKVGAYCTSEKSNIISSKLCTPNADCIAIQSEGHSIGKCYCRYGWKNVDGLCVVDSEIPEGQRSTPRTTTTTETPERGELILPIDMIIGGHTVNFGENCQGNDVLPFLNKTYCNTYQRTVSCSQSNRCECNMGDDSVFDESRGICVGLTGSYCLIWKTLAGIKECVDGAECVLEEGRSRDYSFGTCQCRLGYIEDPVEGTCTEDPTVTTTTTRRPPNPIVDFFFVDYGEGCAKNGLSFGGIFPPESEWVINVPCKNYEGTVECQFKNESDIAGVCSCNQGDIAYFDSNQNRCLGKVGAYCTAEKPSHMSPKLCTSNAVCAPIQSEGHAVGQCQCEYGFRSDENGFCVEDNFSGRTTTTTEAPDRGELKIPYKLLFGKTIVGYGEECQGADRMFPFLNRTDCDTHQGTVSCSKVEEQNRCGCNMGTEDSILDESLEMCVGLAGSYCLTRRNLVGFKACVEGADCFVERGQSMFYSFGTCQCLRGYVENPNGTCSRDPSTRESEPTIKSTGSVISTAVPGRPSTNKAIGPGFKETTTAGVARLYSNSTIKIVVQLVLLLFTFSI